MPKCRFLCRYKPASDRRFINTSSCDRMTAKVGLLKLLLDEMYAGLKEYFQILGWDVVTVHDEGLKGRKDREVVEHAKKHDMLLVTQDPKPSDLAELIGAKCVLISSHMIAKIADERIREKYPALSK